MAPWVFADGTELHLGGEVKGSSRFAGLVRDHLTLGPIVYIGPMPVAGVQLDPDEPTHLDSFARNFGRVNGVPVTSRPPVTYPPSPYKDEPVPGQVY